MTIFLITLAIFLLLLLYLAITLSIILEKRGQCEDHEYVLKKAFERRYNLAHAISLYLKKEDGDALLSVVESSRRCCDIKEESERNKPFVAFISKLKIEKEDEVEFAMVSLDIDRKIEACNAAIRSFNKVVFSTFVSPVAKMCRVERKEEI